MNITQIVFSPTGGTQKVVDILSSTWNLPINTIDLTDPTLDFSTFNIDPEDLVLLAIPSYAGRVPELAAKRLTQIQGHDARCVLVCVYGNRAYEDTLIELSDLAGQCHFQVVAAIAAIAKHSIMMQFATDRPDVSDVADLQNYARQIQDKLDSRRNDLTISHLPGNRPYKQTKSGMIPYSTDDCNECGLCAALCPAQAIDPANPKLTDPNLCISCMRCVAKCPNQARQLNPEQLKNLIDRVKDAISSRKNNELFL